MVSANITELLATYIHALHILHLHGVLDGYGHLSVRNPDNPPTFFLMGRLAPALVSSPDDIGEFRVSDAEPVSPGMPQPPIERYIHSEVLKRYPDVNVVLHGHSPELFLYSLTDVPLRPWILDTEVPLFDIFNYLGPDDPQSILVNTPRLGAALAAVFDSCPVHSDGNATATGHCDDQDVANSDNDNNRFPAHNLVLMQSHGFTAVATDIKTMTFLGVNAVVQARIQSEALQIQHAYTGKAARGHNGIDYLTPQQVRDGWSAIIPTVERPWQLWVREVQVNPLYENELDADD
ncbi:arad-like aldolase/epimerase [Parathielavia appendiculata]|uniref:Arad-like aldolase/epimerase n=1 Tax=Parathielavia appendiculata TaxID=2587402 RepID=A0AAN6Z0A3_9PEZI|nr:arad-like aldolase/epimerase [Parathielavia appendiculata]